MLKPEHVKTNLFGNCIINGQFRIGLSLFDFKQLLLYNGNIVQWFKVVMLSD